MSKLSSKNQITVPKDVLRRSGLRAGDHVRVRSKGKGRLEVVQVEDLIDKFAGALPGVYPKDALQSLRDEWHR